MMRGRCVSVRRASRAIASPHLHYVHTVQVDVPAFAVVRVKAEPHRLHDAPACDFIRVCSVRNLTVLLVQGELVRCP